MIDYIACGDCLQLMQDIPDGSIDMILCDLPYGTTQNKFDVVIPFAPLWERYKRIAKSNAAIVLFSQQPFSAQLVCSNPSLFRYEWIWSKPQGTGFLNANRMPLKAHENILVFYRKMPVYNPQKTLGKPYKAKSGKTTTTNYGEFDGDFHTENKSGLRYPVDILRFGKDNRKSLHPHEKPVALLEYLVKTYTHPGEIVLDNCMGSGSTCVAAINTGRHYIGFEKEPEYFEIAKQRIENAKAAALEKKGAKHD